MKIKRICAMLMGVMMLFTSNAFAAEVSVSEPEIDLEARSASITVTVTDSNDPQRVSILVLADAELGDANIAQEDIAYIDQVAAAPTGTDGETTCTFNFRISEKFADVTSFNAYVGGVGVAAPECQQLRFAATGGGDCNGDGMVNISDYNQLITAYGKTSSQDGFDAAADFNADNMVNISDYNTLITNYGKVL